MNNYILYKGAWLSLDIINEHQLSTEDCTALLNRGGYLVRNVFDFDCKENTSFWYVIKDSFGGMEELSSRTRNKVRKSLRLCDVRIITKEEMLEYGFDVHRTAAAAYRVKAHVPCRDEFKNRLTNQKEGYEYWGSFRRDNGQMIAFSMNYINYDSAEYQTLKAIPEFRTSHYAFYGLLYEMNRYYLEEKGLRFVNDGARSITNHSNVQPFLMDTFNFRKAYCHLRLTYKWWFGMVIKVLYPLRKFIKIAKVQAILNMEAMARGEL